MPQHRRLAHAARCLTLAQQPLRNPTCFNKAWKLFLPAQQNGEGNAQVNKTARDTKQQGRNKSQVFQAGASAAEPRATPLPLTFILALQNLSLNTLKNPPGGRMLQVTANICSRAKHAANDP